MRSNIFVKNKPSLIILHQNATVESAIRKYNNKDVKWSSQGMMRLMPECMNRLFQPTLDSITEAIANVLNQPGVSGDVFALKADVWDLKS